MVSCWTAGRGVDILPFVPAAMLATFLTGIFSLVPFIAKIFGLIAEFILKYSIFIINEFSKFDGAQLEIQSGFNEMLICYFCLILLVIFMSIKVRKNENDTAGALNDADNMI